MDTVASRCVGGGRRNHICWVHAGAAEFHDRAAAFLREGLAMGQRVLYLGDGPAEHARQKLHRVAEFQELLDAPGCTVDSVDDWYRSVQSVASNGQVKDYRAAARAAVAEGYAGLRIAVEASGLVRTGPQREMVARYEHVADRWLVDEPLAALCGYDAAELGATAAAELACLHPQVSPGAAPFQWWAASHVDMGLSGEIDIASVGLFDMTMARTLPLLAGRHVVVDARHLTFIDHRGLLTLERHALANELEVVLHTNASVLHRLATLLQLHAVSVVST